MTFGPIVYVAAALLLAGEAAWQSATACLTCVVSYAYCFDIAAAAAAAVDEQLLAVWECMDMPDVLL
jgi:hypothetical protein